MELQLKPLMLDLEIDVTEQEEMARDVAARICEASMAALAASTIEDEVASNIEEDDLHPLVFDVPVRSPKKADAMTPGRLRLEGYINSPIHGVPTPNSLNRQLRKEILAVQAREANAKKRKVSDKIKLEQEMASAAKRRDIERDQDEKRQRREAKLLQVSSPKGRHVNLCELRKKEAQAVEDLKSKIQEDLSKAQEKAIAAIAERGSRAGHHNEAVAAKRTSVLQQREADLHKNKEILERDQDEKQQRREAKLMQVSSPKGRHVNVCEFRKREAQAVEDLKSKIEEDLSKAQEKATAAIAERGSRAGHHNEAVAAKRTTVLQRREEELHKLHKKKEVLDKDFEVHVQKAEEQLRQRQHRASSTLEHVRHVAEKQKCAEQKQADSRRHFLEGDMSQKVEKQQEAVASRGTKAGQHNEVVAARCAEMQKSEDEAQKRAMSLTAVLDAHTLKAEAQVALRSERAGQHNEKVAERLLQVQRHQEERQKEILAKWEQKKGSKVLGELWSGLERGPAGWLVVPEGQPSLEAQEASPSSAQEKKERGCVQM